MTARAFDVCVLGSFMKDLVARAPRRPRTGETVRGDGFDEFLGGKGVNQAVAAARSGARTAMIGRLGVDRYGDEFADLMAAERIDADQVGRDPVLGTGVGLPVVEANGANSIIIVPRANDAVDAAAVERAGAVIRASRVLLVQLELPVETAVAALRIAHAAGVVTVLNPAPFAPLPPELAGLVDVVVPNEVEAEQLTGQPCDDDKVVDLAHRLGLQIANRGAVLTLGGRGAVAVDLDRSPALTQWLPAYDVDVRDTVGAGDAFCGALAARLAAGDNLVDAARFANAAGALATTRPGAVPAMPRSAEIADLMVAAPAAVAPLT